jgi:LysR family glycine cleavage system transcriptional activator
LAKTKLEAPGDLLKTLLLRNPNQKWRPWFLAAGLDVPEPSQGPFYNDAGLYLQAAAEGQGVALARSVLAAGDLASGRLVRLCETAIEDSYSWFVVWREPLQCDRGDFDRFRQWLEAEAGESEGQPPAKV